MTEPSAGSLKITAARKGNDYIISGTKRFITNMPCTGILTAMESQLRSVRTEDISAFSVNRKFASANHFSDYDIERCYRDMRLFRIYEGITHIQQQVIAKNMVKEVS